MGPADARYARAQVTRSVARVPVRCSMLSGVDRGAGWLWKEQMKRCWEGDNARACLYAQRDDPFPGRGPQFAHTAAAPRFIMTSIAGARHDSSDTHVSPAACPVFPVPPPHNTRRRHSIGLSGQMIRVSGFPKPRTTEGVPCTDSPRSRQT